LVWLSYSVPAAVTPISEGYKRFIVSKYGVSPEKVHVVEVGVDKLKPIKSSAKSDSRFTVMYSRVLGYDFDIVLDAAQLLTEHNDIVFVIRGVGERAAELKDAISERGLVNARVRDFQPKFLNTRPMVSL